VNADARGFSEPGAGIPHAGIFGGADGQLSVLRYPFNGGAIRGIAARRVRRELRQEKTRAGERKLRETFGQKTLD
jgi:hypothetical protein